MTFYNQLSQVLGYSGTLFNRPPGGTLLLRRLQLDKESNRLATVGIGEKGKPTDGFEPSTPGLQNQSSTVELRWHNRLP